MGFDFAWFNELRKLSQNVIQQVPVGDQRIYPDMSDLWVDNTAVLKVFNNTFFEELVILTSHLRKSGYKFHPYFKIADVQHIIDFPEGRACLGQWNIGFTAEDDPARDSVRVGIGFRINEALVEGSHKDYQNYMRKITLNQAAFNSLFSGSLLYSEPFHLSQSPNFAQAVISDAKNVNQFGDWRFFGRVFSTNNPADQIILNNTQQFSQMAISIFRQITQQGFQY